MKDYVMFVERSNVWVDNNMGYYHEFIEAWGLTSKGVILELYNSRRKRGRPAKNVMKLMAQEIRGDEDENV